MKQQLLKNNNFNLFSDRNDFIEPMRLYFAFFQQVPTVKIIDRLNLPKLRKWLEAQTQYRILNSYSKQLYCRKQKKIKSVEIIYLLENELLLYLFYQEVRILHNSSGETKAADLLFELRRFTEQKSFNEDINVVVSNARGGLRTTSLRISKSELHLSNHYNDPLQKEHPEILQKLKSNSKSGLHLFYGIPGTGKSTYIRYLIRSIKKKVIFLPPNLASNLDKPEFFELLINYNNAVLVIEDAEELLKSREAGRNSSISMLLNLTDGLLGESLGIQVIATFNTDLCNIDNALLRKGRLLSLYEFKALTIEKSSALLQGLGHQQFSVNKEMTLAEIFNVKSEQYEVKKSRRSMIGFAKQTI